MIALALMLTRPADYIAPIEPLHDLSGIREEQQEDEDEEQFKERRKAKERLRRENQERRDEVEMTERLRSKRWADNGSAFERLAYMVAVRILHACAGRYKDDEKVELPGPEYIMEGARWDDPGLPLELGMYLKELLETHVDILWKGRLKQGGAGSDSEDSDSETSYPGSD
ncbi:uncharacterized protein SCHCODRAFT_02514241 [Schizophyllum commune H4-8]|nr:uncharacterized protein SCHCODRAFT_02514241 [Schizophyllum commune H4-8]KAI5887834.1 hypothetical protein SCHCODRAFT_02514241 [Schizophyllum commune H4-8]